MYETLKECLKAEVQKGTRPFSWSRTIRRAIKCSDRRFYFWLRVWGYLFKTNKFGLKGFAKRRIRKLNREYSIDINPAATIGPGFKIVHFTGIVIRGNTIMGKNTVLRQNVTIGARNDTDQGYTIIGDNVEFGASSCIIGDIKIGDNVTVGAMSLINKDVPDNHTVYNSKDMILVQRA
jgi:serine O-acetyltransferase